MLNIWCSDYYELAMILVAKDPDSEDFENDKEINALLEEKYNIDFESFEKIMDLIKTMVYLGINPFEEYKFVADKCDKSGNFDFVLSDN